MKIINIIKKILIISTILVVIISIVVLWYKSNTNNKKSYEITTSLQDKFLITERLITNFPEFVYDVEIFDYTSAKKKSILKLHNVEDIHKNKISVLYSNDNIKSYSYLNYIFYKEKQNQDFKTLEVSAFEELDADNYAYLIPVAREITHRDWGFAHYVSEFLLKSNDSEAINIMKRYARGEFTLEELKNNKYSSYSENEIQEYFKRLLIRYSIQD